MATSDRELARTLRALPTVFRVNFAAAVAYRSEMIVWMLHTTMPLVMLALWTAVAREAPVGRFGEKDFQAYFLAMLGVRLLTGSWVVWEMNQDIRGGALSTRLLRPFSPILGYLVENAASVPLKLALVVPVFVGTFAWLGASHLAHDPVQWAIVLPSLAGAFAINFTATAAIGALGLYWESSLAVFDLWLALVFVFAGYLVPIELFPPALAHVARWLPFRFTLAFPVENLLGLVGRAEALEGLAAQWGYVAFFALAGQLLWRRGLARYAAFGG